MSGRPMEPDIPRVIVERHGSRSAIVFAAGHKYLRAIAMGEPIRLIVLPIGTVELVGRNGGRWNDLLLKGKPYPVRRAARKYLRSEIPKTDRARRILRAIARGQTEIHP